MKTHLVWMALATAPSLAAAQSAPKPPTPPTVGEVVITGEAPTVQTAIDRRSYSVTGDLQAQTGSIGDALRNVPSLEVDVQGNVSLRGDPNVTVLIDGKPSSQFVGEARAQALQSLPAERIERVEVITNPSAEFRADGTAGVINLVTKKAKGAGRTGSVRLNVANGERVFGNAATGYNSEKLSVTADAFARREPQKQVTDEDRSRLDAVSGAFADTRQDSVGHNQVDLAGAHAGIDYDLDADTRVSGEARLQLFHFQLDNISHTEREDTAGALAQIFDRAVAVDQRRGNGELSAALRRKFDGDGHALTVNVSVEATEEDRTRDGATSNPLPLAPQSFDRQHVLTSLRQVEVKVDYTRPLADGAKLKAGLDLQFDDNSYDNRGFRGAVAGALPADLALTNLFEYRQTLSQAYLTYERSFSDLTVLAGLRLEDVRLDLDQVTLRQKDQNNYFKAYPSLHLAWKLDDAQQVTASYSHRVQRPGPEEFNAFRFFLDPVTLKNGNADLKPQETHSFEAGYQYRKGPASYLATLYYRENFNGISDVVRDLGGGVFLTTRENVSKSRSAGLELVAAGRLTSALTYNLSGNAYWTELDASDLGFSGTRSALTLSGRANLNWQVSAADFVQINGFLNGERLTPQGSVEPTGMLNIGYRHKFSDRLSGLVTVQDVLATFGGRQTIDTPILKTRIKRDFDTRQILVGLVWTFGAGRPRDAGFDFSGGAAPPT